MNWLALLILIIPLVASIFGWRLSLPVRVLSALAFLPIAVVMLERFWRSEWSGDFALLVLSGTLYLAALILGMIQSSRNKTRVTAK